jgi:hypothetical protein
MPTLELSEVVEEHRPTATWAAALVHALARAEVAGRRPARLTEPKLDTWSRFRGRLTSADFVSLLFEDAAVTHRVPFDPSAVGGPISLDQLSDAVTDDWLRGLTTLPLAKTSAEYILEQALLLGLPTKLARSELHVVNPHQKVLELPGTGGQLAFHLASTQRDLTPQDNFVVACGSWQELTLAGVVALELNAPHTDFATSVPVDDLRSVDHPIRQRSFDFVIGIHPDKGGLFRVEDQLAIWFPAAKIILV